MTWYTRDGKPAPQRDDPAWGQLSDWETEKRVAITEVGANRVSTVYLGLDHQYGDGPPLIFETMIFPAENIAGRYATEEDALRAHLWIVDALREGADPGTLSYENERSND